MNLREETKDIIENRPTRAERAQRNAEVRYKNKKRRREKGGLFPRRPLCIILVILMMLAAAAMVAAMIIADTFPPDLTMIIIGFMLAMMIVTTILLARVRLWKRLVGGLLALAFIAVFGAATYYLGTTYRMLNSISANVVNAASYGASIDPSQEPFNLYITGIDQWEKEKGLDLERSDVNMIVTVNPVTKKILLTSIPRDTYVNLHTAQQMDKLTHTGVYGVDETINTVQDWLGLKLNYYVKMNFTAARDVINAMGGIDVYTPVTFKSSLKGYTYKQGWNHLSGKRALYFARERKAFEGKDSIRVENQQQVIKAMIKKMTSSTTLLTRYGDIMNAAGSNLQTDMTEDEIRSLVKMQITDLASWDVETQKIEGEYDMDYVASLTQKYKFSIYRPDEASVRSCLNAIDGVMNPTAEELAEAEANKQRSFVLTAVDRLKKRILNEEEDESDIEPIT